MNQPDERNRTQAVRWLVWVYFWLLIGEGILRKWIVPQFANPLLLIKDPVVVLCYIFALKNGTFPLGGFFPWIVGLGLLSTAASVAGIFAETIPSTLTVTGYGLRTNFLHLPFLFVMATSLSRGDVRALGKWFLILSVPMALLVFFQFGAAPEAWINKGAGSGSEVGQMLAGVGINDVQKIRAPGVFSFNTGLAVFLSISAAFLLDHFFEEKIYSKALIVASSVAVLASAVLSASRTTTLSVLMVGAAGALCVMRRPRFLKGSVAGVLMVLVIYVFFSQWASFHQGMFVLSERFEQAEGLKVGIVDRLLGGYLAPFQIIGTTPLLGIGLGVGTNVGAGLLVGRRDFLLGETEWLRVVRETGPILGFAYIFLRIALVIYLARKALAALKRGEPLSLLMFGVTMLPMLNGNFGVAGTLGFVVFTAGLGLAAAKPGEEEVEETPLTEPEVIAVAGGRGRSVYAERLHGRGVGGAPTDVSAP